MAILNYVKREIVAKIVYYGPGLSGKTANIQKIHESMDPANVGELTSLATESDRTLFFDFVPIQLGSIAGLNTRFQLFTVPGQVFYNNTRRKVLEDADGVVFVADSKPEQLENNIESLKNFEENMNFYGKKVGDVPFVLQFNKQDLPGVMSEEELNKVLNKWGAPSIRASCIEGFGVMETLAKVSTMVLAHLREQMTKKTGGGPPQGIKRTYSKEGVSDDQVVKNMLEDIASVGGVAEMKAAEAAEKGAAAKPAPATPAKPAVAAKPATPAPAAKPAAPAPAAKPAAAAPSPRLAPTAPLSAEDLLSDLDSPGPAAAPAPAAKPAPIARDVVSRPAPPKPSAATPPKPVSAPPPPAAAATSTKVLGSPAAVAPAAEPASTPSMSRLKPAVPPPAAPRPAGAAPATNLRSPAPAASAGARPQVAARTAEELLESIEQEDRSEPMVQESAGSFGGNNGPALWDDDGPTSAPKPGMAASAGAPSAKGGLFGMDDLLDAEENDPGNKTSVGAAKINLQPALSSEEPAQEASFGRNGKQSAAAELDPDAFRENTPAPPLKVVEAPAAGAAGSGKASLALTLSLFNTFLLLALAAFNIAAFMGWIHH